MSRFTLTPNGIALAMGTVGLYGAGVALGYPVLVAVAVGGAVLLAAGLAAVTVRPAVTLTRRVTPDRITVGEEAVGTVTVTNRSRRRAPSFTAVDRVGEVSVELPVAGTAAGASRELTYTLPGHRRGRLTLGPLTVLREDRLGLFAWAQRQAGDGVLWVHPRVHPLPPLAVGVVPDYEGRVTDNARAGTVTFSSLREYVPGDDPRRVHWRTTARVGTLVVREHVDTTEPTTTIVLDAGFADPDPFEEAVSVAASIARAVERHGRPVALHTTGDPVPASSTLDRLALVDRSVSSSIVDVVQRAPAGGALVVVTGPIGAALLTRLGEQRRRFAPVVVLSVGPGPAAIRRRPGLAVLTGSTAADLAASWHRLVRGEVA